MDEPFDPYLKWLGIPPKDQPPNDYRLLGIELFESDPDVIANAADQRMAHLKTFAVGRHSAVSQKILNEMSAARVRLLNPQEKAKYDAALRKRLAEQRPRQAREAVPPVKPAARPAAKAAAEPAAKPAPVVSVDTGVSPAAPRSVRDPGSKGGQPAWLLPAAIGVGVCVAGVVLALVLTSGGGTGDTEQPDRSTAAADASTQQKPDETPRTPGSGNVGPSIPPEKGPPAELPSREPPAEEPPPDKHPPVEPPVGPPPQKPPAVKPPPAERPPVRPPPVRPPPDEPPTVKPAADDPPAEKRLPEPDDEAKRRALKEIRELYREEFDAANTPQQKLSLSKQLNRDALGTKDNPAARFVLLKVSADLAAEAEQIEQALEIADQIGQWYEVKTLELKADALETVAKSVVRRPGALAATEDIVITARKLTDEALGKADVKAAGRFVRIALPAARKLKDRKLVTVLQASAKELQDLEDRYELAQKAVAALERTPENPRANQVAGEWQCFIAGDWAKGLPWLAKGDDPDLAELANQDLAKPMKAVNQVALGDRWWELSKTKKGLENSRIQARAAFWYQRALPKLSGLERRKLEKRLEEMGVSVGQYALKFDGRRSHVIVQNFGYPGQTPITVEAIVKPAGPARAPPVGVVSSVAGQTVVGNVADAGLALETYSGRWSFRFYYSYKSSPTSSYVSTRYRRASAGRYVAAAQWTHLAGVYDGKQIRLYVDGQLEDSYEILGPHKASPFPFVIGAAPTGPTAPATVPVTGFFEGVIKAVRISNSAVYTQNFQPPDELDNQTRTTRLLFQFNEGKGDRVLDATGRKAVGTIRGAEWIELDEQGPPVAQKANQSGKAGTPSGLTPSFDHLPRTPTR